jgi:hypothetical protein
LGQLVFYPSPTINAHSQLTFDKSRLRCDASFTQRFDHSAGITVLAPFTGV